MRIDLGEAAGLSSIGPLGTGLPLGILLGIGVVEEEARLF